jgi:GxxExxY protein
VNVDTLSNKVIGCAIEVHKVLGPGLLESAYEQCLARELTLAGINYNLQVPIPIQYKGYNLSCGYRIDIFAEGILIIELKTVERILPLHQAQLLTYMKITKTSVGLIINFNVNLLRNGLKRLVL